MAGKRLSNIRKALSDKDKAYVSKRSQQLHEEYLTLQDLRKAHHLTQEEMAKKLHVKQESISRFEKRSDVMLSTLREHIEAMGGHLDLVVTFPGREPVVLRGYGDLG